MKKSKTEYKVTDRFIISIGLILTVLEIWKQLTLWLVEFDGRYNVWYFPFQLCSVPMYIITVYALTVKFRPGKESDVEKVKRILLTFLQDYGFLGGIMSLIVHDGLLHPGHILLTAHGFIWHILLVVLSLYISFNRLSLSGVKGFLRTVPLFFCFAALAELINIALHSFGDCDMFYISPYHISSQPVFSQIDMVAGRWAGIFIYLAAVVAGAFIVHTVLENANKLLTI
ncbi:hypothetical protein UYO_2622 [Lachnospiraceae bacterium JC7]|nr:hypothetical protein UYO_2622 [Lachnospiraceae bacterium JC7]